MLVNNAGVQNAVSIDQYTDEQRSRILRVNLEAPVELIRAVSKQMVRRKGRPEEVAEAIRWLAVDAPEILNGAVIDVTDGCFLR